MAVDQEAFARSMRAVRKLDAVTEGLVRALQHLTDATKELFRVDGAGLMLLDEDGVLRWVSVSDETGLALEQAQQELGEGPCVAALEAEGAVATIDLATDERWPRLSQALVERKIRGVLSIPVRLRGHVVGTLNVLANVPRDWDDEDTEAVAAYAGVVGHLLDTAVEAQRAEQLEYALTARILVEQAKGVLMERENLPPAEAWERLRATARSERRGVREVAQELVASATPDGEGGEPPAGQAARHPAGAAAGDAAAERGPDTGEVIRRAARLATDLSGGTPEAVG
jgi:GAF domain-containing protein